MQGAGFPAVLLRHADRVLFISIGMPEAGAIQLALLQQQVARPMTHDLICNILAGMRGRLQSVTIYKLEEQTFFAYLSIEQQDEQGNMEQLLRIDARPSDGIALAARVHCPIYVNEAVMDEAGHDAALLRPLFEDAEGDDPEEYAEEEEIQEFPEENDDEEESDPF